MTEVQNQKYQPEHQTYQKMDSAFPTNSETSNSQKWQKIIRQNQNQEQETPFLLKQQSFKTNNRLSQYEHQKAIMEQTAKKGRQLLIDKNYLEASKQLSKTLMAFQFIAKNHFQTVEKEHIKALMISTVIPAYNNLALCYLKLNNYELVISFTNQILGQDPGNIKARYRRALANKQLKNTEEAIRDFEMVKKMDPQMQSQCNQKIKESKLKEIELRKKRKQTAKKFISGYQSQDTKVSLSEKKVQQNEENKLIVEEAKQEQNDKIGLFEWIKQKCSKFSRILSNLRGETKIEQKQN